MKWLRRAWKPNNDIADVQQQLKAIHLQLAALSTKTLRVESALKRVYPEVFQRMRDGEKEPVAAE